MSGEGLADALAMIDHRLCPLRIENGFKRRLRRNIFLLRFYLLSRGFILYARIAPAWDVSYC